MKKFIKGFRTREAFKDLVASLLVSTLLIALCIIPCFAHEVNLICVGLLLTIVCTVCAFIIKIFVDKLKEAIDQDEQESFQPTIRYNDAEIEEGYYRRQ